MLPAAVRLLWAAVTVCNVQVTTKLKPGKLWDHEGTYMGGIGFKYRGHVVVCEVTDDSELRRALLLSPLCKASGWSRRAESHSAGRSAWAPGSTSAGSSTHCPSLAPRRAVWVDGGRWQCWGTRTSRSASGREQQRSSGHARRAGGRMAAGMPNNEATWEERSQ